jgi:trans-aconitate 2-methyltransferase
MRHTIYNFSSSPAAALRLEDIAGYFNPPAASFICRFTPKVPDIILDLGCGPGFTTNMMAETTCCPDTYGMDSSPGFLNLARKRFGNCKFLEYDVTRVPFPVTASILYSRFLPCHLRDPLDVVDI